jgi:hypothetical protein
MILPLWSLNLTKILTLAKLVRAEEFNWLRFPIEQGPEVSPGRIWREKKQPRILCTSSYYLGSQFLAVFLFSGKISLFFERENL